MTTNKPLAGRCIAVPETRALAVFRELLQQRGASVLSCPLVAIHDAPDPAPVQAWLADFVAGGCDDLVLMTGEGIRRLIALVQRTNSVPMGALTQAFAQARTISRGPKPARELRALGLRPSLMAAQPTTSGVIETLSTLDLRGRTVGVQLYGSDPNQPLADFLASAGAQARPVAPYVYADEASKAQAESFIAALIAGQADALALTSAEQLRYLFRVARGMGRADALHSALDGLCLAAVGPIVASALAGHGLRPTVQPDSQYFMKPLATALARHFSPDAK